MSRVFIFELPFEYTMYFSMKELIFWGALFLLILLLTAKSFFIKVQGGREGIIGQSVIALGDFPEKGEAYEGQVLCMGEIWAARAEYPVKKDDRLMVSSCEGLMLFLNNDINKKEITE